jgi:hypothetical protein
MRELFLLALNESAVSIYRGEYSALIGESFVFLIQKECSFCMRKTLKTIGGILLLLFLVGFTALLVFVGNIAHVHHLSGDALQTYLNDRVQPDLSMAFCGVMIIGLLGAMLSRITR